MAHFFTPTTQSRNGNWGTKYRPKTLGDVVGNSVTKDKVSHLLTIAKENPEDFPTTIGITGPTGTGKTTIAKIIASSLNDGDLSDVTEFNCGVESGVDAMREAVANARYAPRCNFRVWIMDEIHLLSRSAASALLNIMEEGPPRLVIIWATNEVEKVLKTISGRSYSLPMAAPKPKEMTEYLLKLAQQEQIPFPDSKTMKECVELVGLNCDYAPRLCVNTLQGIADAISSRIVKHASEVSPKELKALIRDVVFQDSSSTPGPTVYAAIASLIHNDQKTFCKLILAYEGDMTSLVSLMLWANHAVLRHVIGVGGSDRTLVNRVMRAAELDELPEDSFPSLTVLQEHLIQTQMGLRSGTNIDPRLLVTVRLIRPFARKEDYVESWD